MRKLWRYLFYRNIELPLAETCRRIKELKNIRKDIKTVTTVPYWRAGGRGV